MRALHVAAMKRPEQMSRQRPYQEEPRAGGGGIRRVAKIERPGAQHEHVADGDV